MWHTLCDVGKYVHCLTIALWILICCSVARTLKTQRIQTHMQRGLAGESKVEALSLHLFVTEGSYDCDYRVTVLKKKYALQQVLMSAEKFSQLSESDTQS